MSAKAAIRSGISRCSGRSGTASIATACAATGRATSTSSEFAYRLTGSSDLYQRDGRRPYASINFIVAHDGFTLHDLVSYNEKHNEANGEDNRDGDNHGRSWNCGVEGPTDDEAINKLRRRQQRNFLATLFLSQGVPMLCGGDEYGRTQHGNNNAYCQDNELSWLVVASAPVAAAAGGFHREADPLPPRSIRSSAGRSFSKAARFAAWKRRTCCGSTRTARR